MGKRSILVTHRWAGTDLLQISVPIIGEHDEATLIAKTNAVEAFAETLGLICGIPIEDADVKLHDLNDVLAALDINIEDETP